MIKDLTQGKPGKVLWQYSLPLFGSIIFQQLYNIADSLVAGHYLGTDALAAVGNSYEITLIYIAFAFGTNIGCSVIVARLFGAKNYSDMKQATYTTYIASTVLSVVLMLLGFLSSGALLHLIHTPQKVFADSLKYLYIYIGGFLFQMMYNVSTGIFSALGDSLTPFFFLAFSSVTNVFVDVLFVTAIPMGVAGVAWATFLCQGISSVLAVFFVLRRLHTIHCPSPKKIFSWLQLKDICTVAIPSILQQSFVSVGNIIIQGLINNFGTATMAGYSAAVKMNNLTITSITALGNGISNFSAQNYGAGKPDRIRDGHRSGTFFALLFAVSFTGLFLGTGKFVLGWFISDGNTEAIKTGMQFLWIIAPFYFTVATKLIADGVLRGTRRMTRFMISTFTDLLLRVLFAIILSRGFGVIGIWCSWPVGWLIASVMSQIFCLTCIRDMLHPKNKNKELPL